MDKMYKEYFDINPKYYAAVTEDLIKEGKVSWKSFYPHESFIKLLETTYNVLSGAATRSIWVEGAYGTGKSHAALTIKSIIDAPDEEVEEYFADYNLSTDLLYKILSVKHSGKILTIHRIGSASINTDMDLILSVQQSIMSALEENGIENKGESSMKDSFLTWLEKPGSKTYFNTLIQNEKYAWDFSGLTVDDIVNRLVTADDSQTEDLMAKIMRVLLDNGIYGLFSDVNDMAEWIKSIIEKNDLTAILFVWDEFSEFFQNHPIGLTGFQTLIEISQSYPFYFLIVAHESRSLFADGETANKTLGRFEKPIRIELQENIAFQLMAQALKITDDPNLRKEWTEDVKPDLNDELGEVCSTIITKEKSQKTPGKKDVLTNEELQNIVPMHPYAALVLKNIATLFNSNQRSMFDFLISNDMNDAKGFKYFINNYGPNSDTNLLTTDLMWDFFCGNEKIGLDDDVRNILDNYTLIGADKLFPDEQRVIKTIIMLQAISLKVSGNELLVPNSDNIELAFMGTDWAKGKATSIANDLIEKNIIFDKNVGGGSHEYCIVESGPSIPIKSFREQAINETNTQALITNGRLMSAIQMPASIDHRFIMEGTGEKLFNTTLQKISLKECIERFKVLVTFAINDEEAQQLHDKILKSVASPENNILFVEVLTPMGKDLYDQYIDCIAYSRYYAKKDPAQSQHYDSQANHVLNEWQNRIANGAFNFFDNDHPGGWRRPNSSDLLNVFWNMDLQTYYYGLDQFSLPSNMFGNYQLANGAGCGIQQELTLGYKNSNKNQSFEKALEGAWKIDRYWEDPSKQSLPIVNIKKKVDEIIQKGFNTGNGYVSILSIFEELELRPYGFMPSSATALVLGFVLKEYVAPEYFWSNGSRNEVMTVEKMKGMIANVLNQKINPSNKYKEEYIVAMTPAMRSFLMCTAVAFQIPAAQCDSMETARDQMRIRMKTIAFPIWSVKYIINDLYSTIPENMIVEVVNDYMGLANVTNSDKSSETELAEDIGQVTIEYPDLPNELLQLFNSDQCRKGMIAYINQYQGGILIQLANQIADGGAYIDEVKNRFNAADANWVWNVQTANEGIDDVILEYKIILESRKTLGKFNSFDEVCEGWNTKTNQIKISHELLDNSIVGDLHPFIEQLYLIKQNGGILKQNKEEFYELLLSQQENFDEFYKNQLPFFKEIAKEFLDQLNDDEIATLYLSLTNNQFTKSKTEYYNYIQNEIDNFIQNQWRSKLLDFWNEKTETKSPNDWSVKYETPILCMFNESERIAVKPIFNTIDDPNPSEQAAKKALEFLNKATFYDRLSDQKERDKCFTKNIVGDFSILLKDLSEIKKGLLNNVHDPIYEWLGSIEVQNQLKKMATKQYKLEGYNLAIQMIEDKTDEQLREYILNMLSNNVDFGIQFLKYEAEES